MPVRKKSLRLKIRKKVFKKLKGYIERKNKEINMFESNFVGKMASLKLKMVKLFDLDKFDKNDKMRSKVKSLVREKLENEENMKYRSLGNYKINIWACNSFEKAQIIIFHPQKIMKNLLKFRRNYHKNGRPEPQP